MRPASADPHRGAHPRAVGDTRGPRQPTAAEWATIRGWFPNIDKNSCWITAPKSDVYNCIAFSVGIDNRWINPASPLAAFQQYYENIGMDTVAAGSAGAAVDGWGRNNGQNMTHGSRRALDPGFNVQGLWESKVGSSWRITHDRNGLNSPNLYGTVLTSFSLLGAEDMDEQTAAAGLPEMEPPLTDEEREQLTRHALTLVADSALIGEFELRRVRYTRAFEDSALSDTAAGTALPEFADLVALGGGIVPLVVAALDEPGGFFLLEVLDALEPGLTAAQPHDPLTGRQSLARTTARAWLAAR